MSGRLGMGLTFGPVRPALVALFSRAAALFPAFPPLRGLDHRAAARVREGCADQALVNVHLLLPQRQ
jgi:hypothetical protein